MPLVQVYRETVQTNPAFPDEGPASRFTRLSANLSGGSPLDILVKFNVFTSHATRVSHSHMT